LTPSLHLHRHLHQKIAAVQELTAQRKRTEILAKVFIIILEFGMPHNETLKAGQNL